MSNSTRLITSLISAGSDISGAAVGGALGFLAGGPAGAAGAGAVGVVFSRVLQDVVTRILSCRETERVGATAAVAISSIKERLEHGDKLRDDDFFDTKGSQRSSADELFEGILLTAKNTHEEKKTKHLGYIFSNIAFDKTCLPNEANYLIHVSESLTYAQFILLKIFSDTASHGLRTTNYSAGEQVHYQTLSLLHSIRELSDRSLIIMQGLTPSNSFLILDINTICPDQLRLSIGGKRLNTLLELSKIPPVDIDDVKQWLR